MVGGLGDAEASYLAVSRPEWPPSPRELVKATH